VSHDGPVVLVVPEPGRCSRGDVDENARTLRRLTRLGLPDALGICALGSRQLERRTKIGATNAGRSAAR
jgi:hypothetical protein